MAKIEKVNVSILSWYRATIHSRTRGFATSAVRSGIHMACITIAMRHSQGVTMQYIVLFMAGKETIKILRAESRVTPFKSTTDS